MRGVVAAGHPVTARAGADVLRAGGNAVDAAVAAVLMSWVAESPLTGPGAGGFMLVHTAGGEDHLLDFFVAAPGRGMSELDPADLTPIDIHFSEDAVQRFNVGPSSCGAYGNPIGLAQALERFGSAGLGELTAGPARAAREGVGVVPMQAFLFEILSPIFRSTPECSELYAPGGELLREGDRFRFPELGDLLDRLGAEGPGFLYTGDVAGACSGWVLERGGLLTLEDLSAYEVVERDPARVTYQGREVLTNPPPSSGGILIADALGILERLERPHGPDVIAEVMASTIRARDEEAPRERGWSRYEGVPTPEERLRSVFSSDIPENILERDSSPAPPVRREREPEPERSPYAMPSGTKVTEPVLRVVGVGGAGVNAVNRMIEAEVEGVEFLAVNTDTQSLEQSAASNRLHIGSDITRGLGSGSDPDLGRAAAMEDYDELKALLKGSDMVFITAGAGGGTGTGAAPIVARISREVGALTVGIVTKPFSFEGARRGEQADEGVEALAREVDTLIVIPNARLLTVLDKSTSMVDAFRVADDVLRQGVQGISDLITLPGLINLDFADVRTIMAEAGQALLGIGMGTGEHRAMDAVEHAIESPLLETSLEGARSILLSVTGGRDLSLFEVNEAAKAVAEAAHPDANIIFGAMVDEKVEDQCWVTVVATGYGDRPQHRATPRRDERELSIPADAEPRVRRGRQATLLDDIDVPEFIPR